MKRSGVARTGSRLRARAAGLLFGAAWVLAAGSAWAHEDIAFAYGAPCYVPQRLAARAGLVVVPSALPRGARVPLVVFLHGLNQDGPLHKWLGARGTPDMRPLFEGLQAQGKTAPFLVAAPSQTRDAARPWGMWQAFDLADFVDRTAEALAGRAEIDRSKIVVFAHSGGGCNLHGSALRAASARQPVPLAVVLADTCFDQGVAETLLLAAPATRIFAYYQTHTWEREFGPFRASLFANPALGPRDRRFVQVSLPGGGAHDRMFTVAVERAFPEVLPPVP